MPMSPVFFNSVQSDLNIMPAIRTIFAAACLFVLAAPAQAQGLLFYLPEDGMGVEYEGEIVQTSLRPDIPDGKETITKARELSIKSVGREDAVFEGTSQPCRWIEIKVVTGSTGEAGIDPGPVGARIYKVLVPEAKIIDKPADARSIPNITLPIVRGFRRTGESAVQPLKTNGLGIYPTICQLVNYEAPEVVSAVDTPQTKAQNLSFTAKHMRGQRVMESTTTRSTNEGNFWVTNEVPFGLARWQVVVTREKKESTARRENFTEVQTTRCTMSVKSIINDAETELVTPTNAANPAGA